MEYERIKDQLEHSPSLKLLRSHNAAFILSFLHKQFKEIQRISIPQSELETKLGNYQEFLQEVHSDDYPGASNQYLNDWCEGRVSASQTLLTARAGVFASVGQCGG